MMKSINIGVPKLLALLLWMMVMTHMVQMLSEITLTLTKKLKE